jgi:hypothetical protein
MNHCSYIAAMTVLNAILLFFFHLATETCLYEIQYGSVIVREREKSINFLLHHQDLTA